MIALGLALLLVQEPPPPPATHARYGPLTQCQSGYAATAGAGEGIFAMHGGFTLASATDGFHIHIDNGYPYRAEQQQATEVEVAGLGRVTRYQRNEGGETPQTTTTYLIPAEGGRPAMLVNSLGFDGSERDLRILGRISRIQSERDCGDFRAPAYPGETPDAEQWRPSSTPGPFLHCQNGVGFPILAGEAVQTSWWATEEGSPLRISSPNPISPALDPIHLVVRGPIDLVTGTGLLSTAYRPRLERMTDGPAILLMPPLTAPIRYGQDPRYRHWIEIAYPAGQEAAARALANRIEFVGPNDPRCHSH